MKALVGIILLWSSIALAQPRHDLTYINVPHDRESRLVLEGERVDRISGKTFTYNLGREVITIRADSLDAQAFLTYVKKGMKNARKEVTITPKRPSFANTEFIIPSFTR